MNAAIGYVLIALAVLNLVGLLLVFRRMSHTPPAPGVEPVAPTVTEHQTEAADVAMSTEALAGMLRRLDHRLGDIEDQVRRTPTVSVAGDAGATNDRALALAQRLARQGASPQDIADTCGISLTEAELLHRLHSPR